jgi:hypothetical protein
MVAARVRNGPTAVATLVPLLCNGSAICCMHSYRKGGTYDRDDAVASF